MAQETKKALYIIHNSETKQCAEFMSGLVAKLADEGAPICAHVIEDKKFASYPDENKNTNNKILYIGDFYESNIVAKNVDMNNEWQFNQFGIRYGRHGNKAVISFDRKRMSEADFNDMAAFASFNFDGYDMLSNVEESDFWNEATAFWDERSTGEKIGIAATVATVIGGVIALLAAPFLTGGSDRNEEIIWVYVE